MADQLCPLCDAQATYEITHDPYCKHFKCPQCIEFFIDSSSEVHIASLPEVTKTERRNKLSGMAQACPSNRIFVIREPRPDERAETAKT